jgi:predicted nucleic acid-binding protein
MRAFFDTNVLVYVFDRDSPEKSRRAHELMRGHVASGGLVLSTQVLQEFYVTVTRKLARPLPEATALAALLRLATLPTVQVDTRLVLDAARRSQALALSFWDTLIIQAAIEGGATRLLSEDLQHGRDFDGVTVQNPFGTP